MMAYEYINAISEAKTEQSAKALVLAAQKDISVSDLDFYGIISEFQAKFRSTNKAG